MTKKHFISLADAVKRARPETEGFVSQSMQFAQKERLAQWEYMRDSLANWCQEQNPRFDRVRWLGYIAGECGPSGGETGKT